jgi:hypothetical protein
MFDVFFLVCAVGLCFWLYCRAAFLVRKFHLCPVKIRSTIAAYSCPSLSTILIILMLHLPNIICSSKGKYIHHSAELGPIDHGGRLGFSGGKVWG